MPVSSLSRSHTTSKKLLRGFVLSLTVIVIATAVWIAGSAIVENIRFAAATNQMLQLIVGAHNLSARDKSFATLPGEDILSDLTRAALITGANNTKPLTLTNPWSGSLGVLSPAPSYIRMEESLPGHDCRRLASFFIKNGPDLGLTVVETRGPDSPNWDRFYDPEHGINVPDATPVEDACEKTSPINLALIFAIRDKP